MAALRCYVNRGRAFGDPNWVTDTAKRLGLEWHGWAPWKTEETIIGLPRLLILSVLSRSDSPDLVAVTNGTRIRINVLRINDLRSTLTSIRFIELYINNTE